MILTSLLFGMSLSFVLDIYFVLGILYDIPELNQTVNVVGAELAEVLRSQGSEVVGARSPSPAGVGALTTAVAPPAL